MRMVLHIKHLFEIEYPPKVTGVTDGAYYNAPITVSFSEGIVELDGVAIESETLIDTEGTHTIHAYQLKGDSANESYISFILDLTPPEIIIKSVKMDPIYGDVLVSAFAPEAMLNADYHLFTKNESFTFKATDKAGNSTTKTITINDILAIDGIEDSGSYNHEVTLNFVYGSVTLNGIAIQSGHVVSEEGNYELIVTDPLMNTRTYTFRIDKTSPIITGVESGKIYLDLTQVVYFSEGSGQIRSTSGENKVEVASGESLQTILYLSMLNNIDYGNIVLEVTDNAGNTSSVTFGLIDPDSIKPDTEAPFALFDVSHFSATVEDGKIYYAPFVVYFNEEGVSAKLNGELFEEYTRISTVGEYQLIMVDLAGNSSTVNFRIESLSTIIGIDSEARYNQNKMISFDNKKYKVYLNGVSIYPDFEVTEDGTYSVSYSCNNYDEFDSKCSYGGTFFTIDKMAPIITGIYDEGIYTTSRTIRFNEGIATLNGFEFESGSEVSEVGDYSLIVTDLAGNISTVKFTIEDINKVKSISLDFNSHLFTELNDSFTLSVNFSPAFALIKEVIWTSSNPHVASVDQNGKVTSLGYGSAIITATSKDGSFTASATVQVALLKVLQYSVEGVGGTLLASCDGMPVISGTEISSASELNFHATPQNGYKVYQWVVNDNQLNNRSFEYIVNDLGSIDKISVEFGMAGDLNHDESITLTDLVKLRRNLAGLDSLDDKGSFNADLNNDNSLTLTDLVKLRRSLAGLD